MASQACLEVLEALTAIQQHFDPDDALVQKWEPGGTQYFFSLIYGNSLGVIWPDTRLIALLPFFLLVSFFAHFVHVLTDHTRQAPQLREWAVSIVTAGKMCKLQADTDSASGTDFIFPEK